jgi:transcription-repair coupling factor (superfamily II helicase)
MMDTKPMDRLVCGDVGYGKTEVALRAAFLAVHNGKQVAILVPTTVLAEQHYATFRARFKDHAVNVACVNRFRSQREQKETLKAVRAGQMDIVIGTHRLLSKDVRFSQLGLVIVDEEQRFGVKHKEKLKKMRSSVDVLALTATPIPRTLHLSLMGIRDISVISTPPEYRQAIITYISEFDEAVIAEAIKRELSRSGQVFFIHNNIKTIHRMASRLRQLVPGARLLIAHGRQDEEELEQNMLAFMRKEIDLLVCTTIVESGLDIPSANTILVNRADKFGLAQIYQLRGRVGRSSEQAYAYLFIPHQTTLTENARKRLKVLMEYSDLGSGFQIAMSDLKIRGGGTILGASQSGHIAAVGYDMFLRLMKEAVAEIKGEESIDDLDPEINIKISAYLPGTYIPDLDQRLSAYRRLTRIREIEELENFQDELIDRYGRLPVEVVHLVEKMVLKILLIRIGAKKLDLVGHQLMLSFSESHQKDAGGLVKLISANSGRFSLTPDGLLKTSLPKNSRGDLLAQIKNILKEIARYVNNKNFK